MALAVTLAGLAATSLGPRCRALTDFVREHMLEPFNAAKATKDIVAHFDHLTSAHEAVLRAQAQLELLTPLLADCDGHDRLGAGITTLNTQRDALRYYFADSKVRLADGLLARLSAERAGLTAQRQQLAEELETLRARETNQRIQIEGHGGGRLAEIEREISQPEGTQEQHPQAPAGPAGPAVP